MAMMNPLPTRVAGKGGSSSNSGKGFYKFTFNSGGTATPAIGNTITGATSGATAIIMNIDHTSGTWAGGDEVGILYISKPSGTFDGTENINIVAQNNVLTMTSVPAIDSLAIGPTKKFTFTSGGTAVPVIGDIITGDTSASKGTITAIGALTGGSWAGGDAAGTLYYNVHLGAFTNGENVSISGGQANILTTGQAEQSETSVYITGMTAAKGVSTTANVCGCEKTDNPVDSGVNFSVNKSSRAVTLSAALSVNIDLATSTTGWTAANGSTLAASITLSKVSTTGLSIQLPATPTTNTRYALFTAGADIDCSAYTKLCFWARGTNVGIAGKFVIKLLDNADNVLVTFPEQSFYQQGINTPYILDYGSALPNNVRKLSIESGSNASGTYYLFTNFYCTTLLPLNALIGLQGAEYYPLKYVNGTDVGIDNDVSANSATGRGYALANVTTQPMYVRNDMINTVPAGSSSTQVQATQVAGANGTVIYYEGGINPVTLEQDGYTFFNGANGNGYGIYQVAKDFQSYNRLMFLRYTYGSYLSGILWVKKYFGVGCSYGLWTTETNIIHDDIFVVCNGADGLLNVSEVTQTNGTIFGYSNIGAAVSNNTSSSPDSYLRRYLTGITAKNNGSASGGISVFGIWYAKNIITSDNNNNIGLTCYGWAYLDNCLFGETTDINVNGKGRYAFSSNHNQTAGNVKQIAYDASATMQTTVKPADAPVAWKVSPTSNKRRSSYPARVKIGRFTIDSTSGDITCKTRACISNAAINGRLIIFAPDLGLTVDQVSATCTTVSSDFSSSELLTVTFTPPAAGAFELWGEAWMPDDSSVYTYSFYLAHPVAESGEIKLFRQA